MLPAEIRMPGGRLLETGRVDSLKQVRFSLPSNHRSHELAPLKGLCISPCSRGPGQMPLKPRAASTVDGWVGKEVTSLGAKPPYSILQSSMTHLTLFSCSLTVS